jgi:tetratricopeptide (TPR) repeat protein
VNVSKEPWKSVKLGSAVIVMLTVVAYLPSMQGQFVFDDLGLISGNQMVKARDGLYRFWFTAEAPDYRPLTWTLWWLEWRLWDGRTTGYHVVNVLLHAANAVLVWVILRRLNPAASAFGAGPGAWLTAAVFALHPVNVATVAWISEQKNTLSMLFYAMSILLYLRFDAGNSAAVGPHSEVGPRCVAATDWTRSSRRTPSGQAASLSMYFLSLLAFLLALLTKTAVVMLPVVLLGCVWWRHGRVSTRDWLCSVPYFAASWVMSLVTIVQHHRAMEEVVQPGGFAARVATAGWIPWFYLSKALAPVNLTLIYPKWEVDGSRWVSYVPGVILIGCLAVFWWNRKTWGRPLLFGLGYFVVMLFPVLGFFDQAFYRYSWVADHWQYYSIVGVIALAVAAGERIGRRTDQRGRLVGARVPKLSPALASVAVLIVLGAATWRRGHVYTDGQTLWRDNVTKNQSSWMAYNNLGFALAQAGNYQEAIEQFERALRLKPDDADAHNNFGTALLRQGRVEDAIRHYEQVVQLEPNNAQAYFNLGVALERAGKLQNAIDQYRRALQIEPESAETHANLGNALFETGKLQEAIDQYQEALRIKPDYADAHNNLGGTLFRLGRVSEAVAHFEQALRLAPGMVETHYNLGVALEQAGRTAEAIQQYEQVLRLKPDSAEAQGRLARLRPAGVNAR